MRAQYVKRAALETYHQCSLPGLSSFSVEIGSPTASLLDHLRFPTLSNAQNGFVRKIVACTHVHSVLRAEGGRWESKASEVFTYDDDPRYSLPYIEPIILACDGALITYYDYLNPILWLTMTQPLILAVVDIRASSFWT